MNRFEAACLSSHRQFPSQTQPRSTLSARYHSNSIATTWCIHMAVLRKTIHIILVLQVFGERYPDPVRVISVGKVEIVSFYAELSIDGFVNCFCRT